MRLDNFIRTLVKEGISVTFETSPSLEHVVFVIVCNYKGPDGQQYAVRKEVFKNKYSEKLAFRTELDEIYRVAMSLKDPETQKSIMSKMPKKNTPVSIPLSTGIDVLGLSKKTLQILYRSGIRTIGSLIGMPEAQLLSLKHFGIERIMEVKECLARSNFRLKG